jgi:arylsulfatase A-like enzyme
MTTMASVFAGRYYTQLHWSRDKAKPLLEPTPRFPELVAEKGVRTLLVAGTLGRIYGRSGVARGFSTEITVPAKRQPATVTVDAIIKELDAAPDGPQLIYAHFIEPHAPYDLAGKNGTKFQRYLREIGLVDRQLARLRAYLEEKGLAERTYLLVSADHGEGFGEHGTFNHAATAYEELVRVPLFLYLPGREGRLLDTPVTLMDVGPTVLDLFGLPTPGFWMGQSLLPLAAGTATKLERPVAVDTGGHVQAYCFDEGLKVIFARTKHTTEAYDLKRDPGELVNLAGKGNAATDEAVQTADLFFRSIALPETDQDFRE